MDDIVIFLWIIIFTIFMLLLYRFIFFVRSSLFEKRISKYTVKPIGREYLTISDEVESKYSKLCDLLANSIRNNRLFKNYIKNYYYFKYDGAHLIANKILIGIIFGFCAFIISFLSFRNDFILITIGFLFLGYLIPDILNYFKKKKLEKTISKDLINVITIMNHSFASGKSIIQAIDDVIESIDGTLKYEFIKIKMDITFGLELETTFKRFYERVPLDEVNYLTTSLIVLNRTGGNISKIFKTIENNFYSKKQIEEELKSSTSSSRFVYFLLIIMPIIMVIIITIFNPDYFICLFNNIIGFLILTLILVLYITYIIVIKKLLKIDFK